jgi:hypothetical protein
MFLRPYQITVRTYPTQVTTAVEAVVFAYHIEHEFMKCWLSSKTPLSPLKAQYQGSCPSVNFILFLHTCQDMIPSEMAKWTYLVYQNYTANVLWPRTSAIAQVSSLCVFSSSTIVHPMIFAQSRSSRSLPSGLRLLLRPLFRPPAPRPRPGLPGGGRTNAKSTEIVWSSNFWLCAPSIAARASSSVVYSISAYP